MIKSYKIKRNLIITILAPLAFFSFLFYVFWTYPIQILTQEIVINQYFLFNNPYIQYSLLVSVFLGVLVFLCHIFLPKAFPYIIGFILVFLIGTFLYKITSYDFGGFIDNDSLSTSKPILGYSFFYFALDGIIPIVSIVIAIFAIKKNLHQFILILFAIFYLTQNIMTLSTLKVQDSKTIEKSSITLSINHPNLLFLMYDSMSTPLMLDIIDKWKPEQREWVKDFTFYDNVTSLSLGGTSPSLPNMIGGYEFAPNKVLAHLKKDDVDFTKIKRESLKYPFSPRWYPIEQSFEKVENILNNEIDISVSSIYYLIDSAQTNKIDTLSLEYREIPIINVSLYPYLPYIFKKNLVADSSDITNTFSWKVIFPVKWILNQQTYTSIKFTNTSKPVFIWSRNKGAHANHASPKYPNPNPSDASQMEDVLFEQVSHNMRMMTPLINMLKKNKVYDNTRIILAADHGVVSSFIHITLEYLRKISSKQLARYYARNFKKILNPHYLPVMVMDKGLKTSQSDMKIDSRFLSLADLHGSIVNTFTNYDNTPDYLQVQPPKRQFNTAYIKWQMLSYLGNLKQYKSGYDYTMSILTNNELPYLQVRSIKEGEFEIKSFDYDNIGDLPPYEIIE